MIRHDAAVKLARQLLEPRLSRVNKIDDKVIDMIARVIMNAVKMDEQRQKNDQPPGK